MFLNFCHVLMIFFNIEQTTTQINIKFTKSTNSQKKKKCIFAFRIKFNCKYKIVNRKL